MKIPAFSTVVLAAALLVELVAFGYLLERKKESTEAETLTQLSQERDAKTQFELGIVEAEKATMGACGQFWETVDPPEGLIVPVQTVMMGKKVDGAFDPSIYELRTNGDKIELWANYGPPPADPPEKLGEKISATSPKCLKPKH